VLGTTDTTRGTLKYGYALPPDCLHLRDILYTDGRPLRGDLWRLEGSQVWSYYASGLTADHGRHREGHCDLFACPSQPYSGEFNRQVLRPVTRSILALNARSYHESGCSLCRAMKSIIVAGKDSAVPSPSIAHDSARSLP
jgi:hypothetical protein